MKRFSLIIICSVFAANVSAQKKVKATIGLEAGIPLVNFAPSTSAANPIIQGGNPVPLLSGASFSAFVELMHPRKDKNGEYGPGSGLKLSFGYTKFMIGCDAPDFSGPESYKVKYLGGSLLYKFCIISREGDVPSSKDPDRIRLVQHDSREWDAYYLEGETHAGYHTVASLFPYVGIQYNSLLNINYSAGNMTYITGFETIKSNIEQSDLALVAGVEARLGRVIFNCGYQYGLQSIYRGEDIRLKGFLLKAGFAF